MMEYRKLGQTGIEVSRLCVGCLSFGKPFPDSHAWTLNPKETETIVQKALDLGFNFFDTANTYAHGTSEEYLGRAIRNCIPREKVVIATKVYFNEGHLSKKAIQREIESSLKRLNTDYVDLYIIHRFGARRPCKMRKGACLGCFGHVWISVLQHAVCCRTQRMDAVLFHAEPL